MKSQSTVKSTLEESKLGGVFQYARGVALRASGKSLLTLAVLISLVAIPLLTRADQRNEKRKLTGNWMGTVTRLNPPPGQAADVLSLMTFFEDGNLLQEGSDPSIRSTGRGKWERIGHQQFSQEFLNLRFDAARIYIGTRVVTSTITLSDDGNQYQAETVAQTFDTSGNLLTTGLATEVAQRLF
jgi:hypothetical protein